MKKDILIIGKLIGSGKTLAQYLDREKFSVTVLHDKDYYSSDVPVFLELSKNYKEFDIKKMSYMNVYREVMKHKLIISINASFMKYFYLFRFYFLLFNKPIIEFHGGSDIKILSGEKSFLANLYRHYIKNVDINFSTPEMASIRNLIKLKLKNTVITKGFPYLKGNLKHPLVTQKKISQDTTIKLFMPSHLMWTTASDGKPLSKGNDKFLLAIKRLVESHNCQGKLIITILNRGPDKELAINFIKDNNLSEYFVIKEHMSKDELYNEMLENHILVNSFEGGAPGGLPMESASIGMPTMNHWSYIADNFFEKNNAFLNVFSEDDIYSKLVEIIENKYILISIANDTYKWYQNISSSDYFLPLRLYYSILTGEDRFEKTEFERELELRKIKKFRTIN